MRKIFIPIALALITSNANSQVIVSPAIPQTLTLATQQGNTPMNVIYNPNYNLYYTTNGGYASCQMQTFDASGNYLTTTVQNIDYRGGWWNPNTNQEECNEYAGYQLKAQDLTAGTGWPLTTWTSLVSMAQPDAQSMGAYDKNNNWVVYYSYGTLYEYDRNTGTLVNSYTISGVPNGTGNINPYPICCTGCPGKDYLIYDYNLQQAIFINTTGQYVGYSQLPAGAQNPYYYGISYTNGMLWLCDQNTYPYTWNSYQVMICDPCAATVTVSGPTEFCAGGSVTLNANTGLNYNYQWKRNGTNLNGATTSSYTATTSGSYAVFIAHDTCLGSTSAAVVITVDTLPVATTTPTGTVNLCGMNATVDINANAGGYTYSWIKDGNLISGATSNLYTADTDGVYNVIEVNANNCTDTSANITVIRHALPTPHIAIAVNNGLTLSVSNTYTSYQWFRNGTTISGATNYSYHATINGTYSIQVTDGNNCSGNDTLGVSGLAINNIVNSNGLSLYPNPSNGTFTLSGEIKTANNELTISVTDITGRELHRERVAVVNNSLNTKVNLEAALPAGHYILKVITDEQNYVLPFVKQ